VDGQIRRTGFTLIELLVVNQNQVIQRLNRDNQAYRNLLH
jgi:hypothetical protein